MTLDSIIVLSQSKYLTTASSFVWECASAPEGHEALPYNVYKPLIPTIDVIASKRDGAKAHTQLLCFNKTNNQLSLVTLFVGQGFNSCRKRDA